MILALFYIILALLPGFFWVWFYLRKDRAHPEPKKLIIKVFLWGMLATIPAIAIELAIDYFIPYSASGSFWVVVFSTLLVVAPSEEYLKYLVVKEKIYSHPEFDEPVDGIIYAVVAGLGFASLENILVVFTEGGEAVLLRFATATLMHALTTGIVGFYLAMAKFAPTNLPPQKYYRRQVTTGLVIAIILHSVYNIVVATDTPFALIILTVLLLGMYLMLARGIKEIKQLKVPAVASNAPPTKNFT